MWDFVYNVCKWFFNLYWLVYIISIKQSFHTPLMFHITGVMSIIYLITNIKWWLKNG